jgi:hypothetical protein
MSAENVSEDPRWQTFNQDGFPCSCGESHVGLFPVNMLTPAMWDGPKEYAPDAEIRLDRTFISESYCVWQGQNFAMRMRLPLQMRGASPAAFMYTVWAAVERADLEAYIAAKAQNTLSNQARFPARLVSRIAGHPDTVNLMGLAFQQEDGWPPLLLLAGKQLYTNRPDHPLLPEQREGIGLDRALELFAAYGHNMRPAASANNN